MILELAQIMANFVISAILLILVSGLVLSIGVLLWMYKITKLWEGES
jgi:maltodextrin utilization protein YvdJ